MNEWKKKKRKEKEEEEEEEGKKKKKKEENQFSDGDVTVVPLSDSALELAIALVQILSDDLAEEKNQSRCYLYP